MKRFVLPLRTYSLANQREHWAKRARRCKSEREAAHLICPQFDRFPCAVAMKRIAPRMLDDDNLRGALKAIRDGIAQKLGVDDRDPRVLWGYCQGKGKPKEYAVEVEISPL